MFRLAYSCMMLMALGFNNTMHNISKPVDQALLDLATGRLGHYMTPLVFNTSYVGPQGLMQIDPNGDVVTGYVNMHACLANLPLIVLLTHSFEHFIHMQKLSYIQYATW
jgi:hypothetical protein